MLTASDENSAGDKSEADKGRVAGRGLRIRVAQEAEEVVKILPLGREFHDKSIYSDITFSEDKCRRLFADAVSHPNRSAVLMAELHGRTLGFLYCSAGEYLFGEGTAMTTVHVFYVSDEVRGTLLVGRVGLGLIKAAELWSQHRGCKRLLVHDTASTVRDRRLYSILGKVGYEVLGLNVSKLLF